MTWTIPLATSLTTSPGNSLASKGDEFSFTSIPGLKVDIDFSNPNSLTLNNGFITLARDQSGTGNDFIAAASAGPIYDNGRANFFVNDTTAFMTLADNPTLDWATIGLFMVIDRTSANASFESLIDKGVGTGTSKEFIMEIGSNNRLFGAIYVNGTIAGERGNYVSGAFTVGQTHIADMQYDGTNVRVRRNGGAGNQVVVSAASAFNSTSNMFMGLRNGTANVLKTPIKRFLMYGPSPTSAQYDQIITNLAGRYGVTVES